MANLTLKYLVVEDDRNANNSIVRRMSKFQNWSCIGATDNVIDAEYFLTKEKPQLLFLDWEVKGGNTFRLLELIAADSNYHPYVIYFTGYQSERPEIPMQLINNYNVNRYLVKPIFENLTENLADYLREAEELISNIPKAKTCWITDLDYIKHKIDSSNILCFTQSAANPRNKILSLLMDLELKNIEFKATWGACETIMSNLGVNHYFTNTRYSLVNCDQITKTQKPYIWLADLLKVEVTKEKWGALVDSLSRLSDSLEKLPD